MALLLSSRGGAFNCTWGGNFWKDVQDFLFKERDWDLGWEGHPLFTHSTLLL
jgi:hypothetical protein